MSTQECTGVVGKPSIIMITRAAILRKNRAYCTPAAPRPDPQAHPICRRFNVDLRRLGPAPLAVRRPTCNFPGLDCAELLEDNLAGHQVEMAAAGVLK